MISAWIDGYQGLAPVPSIRNIKVSEGSRMRGLATTRQNAQKHDRDRTFSSIGNREGRRDKMAAAIPTYTCTSPVSSGSSQAFLRAIFRHGWGHDRRWNAWAQHGCQAREATRMIRYFQQEAMLQRRRRSSCAASRTIGGYAVTVTVFDDWRFARREIRNGRATSCSRFQRYWSDCQAACCLPCCYLIVIESSDLHAL